MRMGSFCTFCMMVKLAMQNDSFRLSALGGIIWEIKTVAASSFISVTFNHCYRSCNRVTHELPIIVSVVVYNLVICVVESLLSCRADGLME